MPGSTRRCPRSRRSWRARPAWRVCLRPPAFESGGPAISLSDWIRQFQNARSLGQKLSHAFDLKLHDVRLYIPAVSNRTTGMSMGEHTEITAKEWKISREEQDQIALQSHRTSTAAWDRGFFDDLVIPVGDLKRDTIPRKDTSLERLARLPPAFDRVSGKGTL